MATTKPRITITLDPKTYKVLKSISDSSGQAMSAFLCEFIEVGYPTFERMAATFQSLSRAQDIEREKIRKSLEETQLVLEPLAQQAAVQFDLFLAGIDSATVAPPAAKRGRSAPARQPSPPTNRGDTPPAGKRLQASKGKALNAVLEKKVSKKKVG